VAHDVAVGVTGKAVGSEEGDAAEHQGTPLGRRMGVEPEADAELSHARPGAARRAADRPAS
jgi:hypothetical protein